MKQIFIFLFCSLSLSSLAQRDQTSIIYLNMRNYADPALSWVYLKQKAPEERILDSFQFIKPGTHVFKIKHHKVYKVEFQFKEYPGEEELLIKPGDTLHLGLSDYFYSNCNLNYGYKQLTKNASINVSYSVNTIWENVNWSGKIDDNDSIKYNKFLDSLQFISVKRINLSKDSIGYELEKYFHKFVKYQWAFHYLEYPYQKRLLSAKDRSFKMSQGYVEAVSYLVDSNFYIRQQQQVLVNISNLKEQYKKFEQLFKKYQSYHYNLALFNPFENPDSCKLLNLYKHYEVKSDANSCLTGIKYKGLWLILPKYSDINIYPLQQMPQFETLDSTNYFVAAINQKYGLITACGDWLYEPTFDNLYWLSSKILIYNEKNKLGLLSAKKGILTAASFKSIDYLDENGFEFTTSEENRFGLIDSNGKILIQDTFAKIYPIGKFSFILTDTLRIDNQNRLTFYLYDAKNKSFSKLMIDSLDRDEDRIDGCLWVFKKGRKALLNSKSETLISGNLKSKGHYFRNYQERFNWRMVLFENKIYCLNNKLNPDFRTADVIIDSSGHGIYYAFINQDGTSFQIWDYILPIHIGEDSVIFIKKENGTVAIYELKDSLVLRFEADKYKEWEYPYNRFNYQVKINGKWGVWNKINSFVLKPEYDSLRILVDKPFILEGIKSGYSYLFDKDFQPLVNNKYSSLTEIGGEFNVIIACRDSGCVIRSRMFYKYEGNTYDAIYYTEKYRTRILYGKRNKQLFDIDWSGLKLKEFLVKGNGKTPLIIENENDKTYFIISKNGNILFETNDPAKLNGYEELLFKISSKHLLKRVYKEAIFEVIADLEGRNICPVMFKKIDYVVSENGNLWFRTKESRWYKIYNNLVLRAYIGITPENKYMIMNVNAKPILNELYDSLSLCDSGILLFKEQLKWFYSWDKKKLFPLPDKYYYQPFHKNLLVTNGTLAGIYKVDSGFIVPMIYEHLHSIGNYFISATKSKNEYETIYTQNGKLICQTDSNLQIWGCENKLGILKLRMHYILNDTQSLDSSRIFESSGKIIITYSHNDLSLPIQHNICSYYRNYDHKPLNKFEAIIAKSNGITNLIKYEKRYEYEYLFGKCIGYISINNRFESNEVFGIKDNSTVLNNAINWIYFNSISNENIDIVKFTQKKVIHHYRYSAGNMVYFSDKSYFIYSDSLFSIENYRFSETLRPEMEAAFNILILEKIKKIKGIELQACPEPEKAFYFFGCSVNLTDDGLLVEPLSNFNLYGHSTILYEKSIKILFAYKEIIPYLNPNSVLYKWIKKVKLDG